MLQIQPFQQYQMLRLKENITDFQIGIDAIMALRPRQFDWKKESGNSGKNVRGFIAQEFRKYFLI